MRWKEIEGKENYVCGFFSVYNGVSAVSICKNVGGVGLEKDYEYKLMKRKIMSFQTKTKEREREREGKVYCTEVSNQYAPFLPGTL